MKTSNLFRITLLAACIALVFACKKDNQSSSNNASNANVQTSADDQTMASNEDEAVSNDATAALSANVSIAGSSMSPVVKSGSSVLGGDIGICDATVSFDTTGDTKTVTITYNGTNCWGNRTRTGTVTISIPKGVHWRDQGAVVTINVDLTISRKRDGKSIVIKGTKTITNTTGGLLIDLASLGNIAHDISSTFTITFDNGTQRSWNVSKHRVFTYDNGIVITTTGTHNDGTNPDVAEWGTNRFGVAFESRITAPKVIAQSCDFRLTSGENTITRGDNITAVITYGLDSSGNPVTSCPSGDYYAKLVWTNSATNKTYTYIFPY